MQAGCRFFAGRLHATGADLLGVDPPWFDVTLSTVKHSPDRPAHTSNGAAAPVERVDRRTGSGQCWRDHIEPLETLGWTPGPAESVQGCRSDFGHNWPGPSALDAVVGGNQGGLARVGPRRGAGRAAFGGDRTPVVAPGTGRGPG